MLLCIQTAPKGIQMADLWEINFILIFILKFKREIALNE